MDFLEFTDSLSEQMGAMLPGRLRVTDRDVIFKYSKSGKSEQFAGKDIELLNWQRLSGDWAVRIFLQNGDLHRFGGFKESDREKIARHFQQMFGKELVAMEMSLKGWNWGEAIFKGSALRFDVDEKLAFEVPLRYVSQCTTGKNEVIMEFHQQEEATVNLTEMRFHVPSTAENPDPTEAFQEQVMKKASVLTATGDVLAIFREVQCLTPRGRYDIGIYPTFVNMHGKTFDFKITFQSIMRLMLLPHRDGRQIFFALRLDPPIRQGMTRYPFLILLFNMDDDEMEIELPISDDDLKNKYENRLQKEMKGQAYEVISKMVRALVNRKITTPGSFKGHSGTPAIACSYKAAAGYLYPLDHGFIYVHKPPIYVRFDEIFGVNFARSGGTTRTFDFEISVKNSLTHTFSSIEKEEYDRLYQFAKERKLSISSKSGLDKGAKYDDDGSGKEADPYLERMKREGEERESDDSEEESTDEDFNPEEGGGSDVAEEFESNPETTDSEGGEEKPEKKKKEKKAKHVSERKSTSKPKKKKESGAPKRPMSAYFLWLNESRESIKEEFPGISITELTKKAGERWRELKDKTKWEKMNLKEKARYEAEMKEWKASGGADKAKSSDAAIKSAKSPKKSTVSSTTGGSGAGFKSREYISDSESSGDGEPKSQKPPAKKSKKDSPAASGSESAASGSEGEESSAVSSANSD